MPAVTPNRQLLIAPRAPAALPRVGDLVMLVRSMAADNAAALAACVHIAPAPDGEAGP